MPAPLADSLLARSGNLGGSRFEGTWRVGARDRGAEVVGFFVSRAPPPNLFISLRIDDRACAALAGRTGGALSGPTACRWAPACGRRVVSANEMLPEHGWAPVRRLEGGERASLSQRQ